jgi:pyridoxal phosphate enzyme (YggS family)
MTKIGDNLTRIQSRIATAATRSGRRPEEITLVAVTKYVDSAAARQLVAAGCCDFGESRPQDLWAKAADLACGPGVGVPALAGGPPPKGGTPTSDCRPVTPDPCIRWHLIGHLQRNKVERTLAVVSLIHSADSMRLIGAIDRAAEALGRRVPILLEVNVSGDKSKHGFQPEEMSVRVEEIGVFGNVEVRGLMTMAGREGDLAAARRDFSHLRELRERLRSSLPKRILLDELSMGMSGDFEVAIEEGATIVRIGSALFEGVVE